MVLLRPAIIIMVSAGRHLVLRHTLTQQRVQRAFTGAADQQPDNALAAQSCGWTGG